MCATAAAAMASAMTVANAQDGWYGRADLGYTFDGTLDSDAERNSPLSLGGDQSVEDGFGAQLGLGYGFDNGFRLESTVGYRSTTLDVSGVINGAGVVPVPTAPGLAYQPGGSGEASVYDVMFNGIYDFNAGGAIQPYLGAGIGLAKVGARATNLRAGLSGSRRYRLCDDRAAHAGHRLQILRNRWS